MFKKNKRKSVQEKANKLETKSLTRIVISMFIAVIAWAGMIAFEAHLLSDKNVTDVIIAKKNIEAGTYIDENNQSEFFETIAVNSDLVTETTITDASTIEGKVLCSLSAGEIVSTNQFFNTAFVNTSIKDPVSVSFAIEKADSGLNGYLRRGDLVDIIITKKAEDGTTESNVYMENTYIINAYDEAFVKISEDDTTSKAVYFEIYIEKEKEAEFSQILTDYTVSLVRNPVE